MLNHKIDFSVIITATNANPNGDPLNGNRPRETFDGCGEISDVCIKRKIRNRLLDMYVENPEDGNEVLMISNDSPLKSKIDDCTSVQDRVELDDYLKTILKEMSKKKKTKNKSDETDETDSSTNEKAREKFTLAVCKKWIDVRSFGQVFAFGKNEDTKGVSIGIRGPVSIHTAFSVDSVDIITSKIVKSLNGKAGDKEKESDTMGEKHRVAFGLYVIHGSINCQLAEKTGFSDEDAAKIKEALCTLFENDASSARPEGSMEVCRVYWWEHDCKTPKVSSAKIHRALKIRVKDGVSAPHSFDDYEITLDAPDSVQPEIIDLM